jgi:hypothetical protein
MSKITRAIANEDNCGPLALLSSISTSKNKALMTCI